MIKINLLGNDTAIDNTGYFVLAGYVLSLVVSLVACFFVYSSTSAAVVALTGEKESSTAALARLQETTKDVKDLQKKKDELNSKLLVIAKLKRSKVGPVHVLDDLNMALPEKSWLTEIKEASNIMKVGGYALDNQTLAVFMKDLAASDYFDEPDLVETKQSTVKGVKINLFTLQAKINYAGKLKLADEKTGVKNEETTPPSPDSASPSAKPASTEVKG